jgi:hypothetical protein
MTDIPTPKQVYQIQGTTVAALALNLKNRLVAALNRGETSVEISELESKSMPGIMKILEAEFVAAGWTLVDHACSVSVRATRTS